tara:strand:- start:391 stop:603 length:213 start_codon:yes stop_codon:yes gene_type:complete
LIFVDYLFIFSNKIKYLNVSGFIFVNKCFINVFKKLFLLAFSQGGGYHFFVDTHPRTSLTLLFKENDNLG